MVSEPSFVRRQDRPCSGLNVHWLVSLDTEMSASLDTFLVLCVLVLSSAKFVRKADNGDSRL